MSATVREARMMEQRMVPPARRILSATPGRVCRMGRCAPFFVWKSPGSTEPCAARPTRASFPAPFLRALPLPPPSDLPVAPKESAFAFFR